MYSAGSRISYLFGHVTTTVFILSVLIAVASISQLYYSNAFQSPSSINVTSKIKLKRSPRFSKPAEHASFVFDIDADFSPFFNWNTKSLFVYLKGEYPGKRPDIVNEVVFWDHIIEDKKDAHIHLVEKVSKYTITDVGRSFNNQNMTVQIGWSLQPYVGILLSGTLDESVEVPLKSIKLHNK